MTKEMNKNKGDEGLSAYIWYQIHVMTYSLAGLLMELP